MYNLDVKPEADRIFHKLAKKNPKQLKIISNKIKEIRKNPDHNYKFLRKPLQKYNRVHIDKHFVLIFKINHQDQIVDIYYFDHHDLVYQWRPKN
ncbi:MAG: addiction module toxin RelE [Candidatus Woesearchaeota archaeon]|nr:addiction module toxin RelE [Candidatus Woesearchaeota archaeon]MDP7198030.1 addiction module toxin RelE [Candidatus Woesearchaeota archaeon]MDP7466864.1 addiction module toxin RelE [Candidatus Woesearchaeota archaeon]MDP7647300.1 addiction module toxin RelE [Candidatus Woesearchaeota archaeon]